MSAPKSEPPRLPFVSFSGGQRRKTMPTRYLKPGVRDSEAIDNLSPQAEILFYRLLVTVDDFGRFDARPAMIKAQCFPIKDSISIGKCKDLLDELNNNGLIYIYEASGKLNLMMCKWDNVPRAKESKYPAPVDSRIQVHTDVYKLHTDVPLTVTVTETKTQTETYICPPSGEPEEKTGFPKCSHQEVIDLYHKHLPTLRKVEVWNDARKGYLRQRWREVATELSEKEEMSEQVMLDYWARLFKYISQSKFLTGRVNDKGGRAFVADLEWILKPSNFAKIIEGKYHVV